jgi:SAM-dependent methyltransferase
MIVAVSCIGAIMKLGQGTAATRDFYNRIGWRRQDGTLVDTRLFGWTKGPIRLALEAQRKNRLRQVAGGPDLRLAELGCGGTPAVFLAERCKTYTAVDFSSAGLSEAASALKATKVPFATVEADITDLPFEDGAFDVVYSAHAIYHIDTVDGQTAAFREAMRVVRPGGRAIFVLANPFPLLFPIRLVRRVLDDAGTQCGPKSPALDAALAISADALGMDEAAVGAVGRCEDHRACGAQCSVRPPRIRNHNARTHDMARHPAAGSTSPRPRRTSRLLRTHCREQIEAERRSASVISPWPGATLLVASN